MRVFFYLEVRRTYQMTTAIPETFVEVKKKNL
jgi:hypothetical protein